MITNMSRMERLGNIGAMEICKMYIFQLSYLANKHFENRMLMHRVALKLVYLFSTGSAAYLLLQGIICHKDKINLNLSLSPFHFFHNH